MTNSNRMAGDRWGRQTLRASLTVSSVAMLMTLAVGCGGGGQGKSQQRLSAEQAIEAAAGVAISTINAIAIIPPRSAATTDPSPIELCSEGGSRSASCREDDSESNLTIRLDSCRTYYPDAAATTMADGSYTYSVNGPDRCNGGSLTDSDIFTVAYDDYVWNVVDTNGTEYEYREADATWTSEPRGPGCPELAFVNDTRVIDGSLRTRFADINVDVSIEGDQLLLDIDSEGIPCALRYRPNGRMEITDRATGRQFEQTISDAVVTYDGAARLDAMLENTCLGPVQLHTVQPLAGNRPDGCPTTGQIEVRLDDGHVGSIVFTGNGGVMIDYDNDGATDATFTSCLDPSLTQCAG